MSSVLAKGTNCSGVRAKRAMQLLGGMFAVLLLCVPAFSQGSFGRILGTVTDQSGGVVTGATVSVIDTERGVTRTLTTDDAGAYNAPNLTAGNYTVRVEAKGFKRLERQGIGIEIGKEVRIDLTVQPGEQNQTVTVTEAVPLVETTNATLGGTLENGDIVDLPLNGRDYQNLLGLRPGVMLQPGGGPWTQSTNGVRPDQSVWMVEGVINENFFDGRPIMGMPSPFTDGASILPVDAIQEFNLMENPKAEYGWKPGAVVNVGIKSGTNQLHGSAYAFGRDGSWDARNYFNVAPIGQTCATGSFAAGACDQLPAQLQQFGGVVGGPIKKDKLFFFAGYEGLRSFIGSAYALTVPATSTLGADPKNSMVDAINALQAAGIARSVISEGLAGCTGDPNPKSAGITAVTCGGAGNLFPNSGASTSYLSPFPVTNTSNNGIAKIDYHVNDKNTINGMFFLGDYTATGEDHGFANVAFTDTTPLRTWSDTASWVYAPNSSLVNELRFGYDRASFGFINLDVHKFANGNGGSCAPGPAYCLNTGVTDPLSGGFPNVNISGFGAGGAQILGTATNRPQYWPSSPYYDIQDSISVLKGKHAFKFGGEFTHIEADSALHPYGRGLIAFNGGLNSIGGGTNNSTSLEDYFAGTPGNAKLLTGDARAKLSWMSTAGYIQDDWRITPKVIINLGLRYTYGSPMKDANNNLGNFDPVLGMVQQGHGIDSVWKGDHRSFEPRLGFAWDLNGKGTTVLRVGGGVIHESYTLATFLAQFQLQNDNATSSAAIPTAAQLFCSGIGGSGPCPANGGGTDGLGVATYAPASLCWDPSAVSTCSAGAAQKTVFPYFTAKCGDGVGSNPSPCDLLAVDQKLRNPYVLNYNLSITHSFGSNLSLEIGYVGNRGDRLLSFTDINQAPAGAGWCVNKLTAAQAIDSCAGHGSVGAPGAPLGSYNPQAAQEARPFFTLGTGHGSFPYLGFVNYMSNQSHSDYNSLQMNLTKRMSHGLSFNASYTYAHGIDTGSLDRFGQTPQDSSNLAAEYGNSDFDVRHRFTITATYNIPGIKGFAQLLEGWQINGIVNAQSSQPWAAWDGGNNFSGNGENQDRWNINGNPADFPSGKNSIPFCGVIPNTGNPNFVAGNVSCGYSSIYVGGNGIPLSTTASNAAITTCQTDAASAFTLATAGCFVSANGKSFLTPPALGTFGNQGRNIFRDSGLKNVDFSVFKNFKFKERYGAQFRAEVFNILNQPTAANPYGSSSAVEGGNQYQGGGPLGFSGVTPDFAAGNPLIGSGENRAIQIGMKLTF